MKLKIWKGLEILAIVVVMELLGGGWMRFEDIDDDQWSMIEGKNVSILENIHLC
jgi:hypothetical protein